MEPRDWLLAGLMQERDLAMLHAWRGLGKSRIAHGIAYAVATGGAFLRWRAPRARGVLLVDGELPREDLQRMLAQAVMAADAPDACDAHIDPQAMHRIGRAPLRVLSSDLCGAPLRSLATPEGRQQIEEALDGCSLLILDSISTLCPGIGPENDAESWEEMQGWLLALRRNGNSVLLIHHDNRSGGQRGTSKREDVLSTVIQLRQPPDYRTAEGCRVEIKYSKARGIVGEEAEPFEAALGSGPNGRPVWTWRRLEDVTAERARQLRDDGLSQREIAVELGIHQSSVSRALRRAKAATEGCDA
jgi:hypothetical protein